jgi:predicted alpha/beta hydrolase
MRRYSPADFGLARIGHFGFFREATGDKLWPVVLNWMNGLG